MRLNGVSRAAEKLLEEKFPVTIIDETFDEVFGSDHIKMADFHNELQAQAPHANLPHWGAFRHDRCSRYRNHMMRILHGQQ